MAQGFWQKLNTNERMVLYGAIVVAVAFILGALDTAYGYVGSGSGDLIAAIVITVIYWLKYSPNQIKWPAPIQTIVLAIAGVSALFAIWSALVWVGIFSLGLFGIAVIVNAVGCAMMAYFAWKEYQAMPKTAPPPPPVS
jgi:hypothetical protein